jgi:uncharacterized protein (TIRG00374 family)
MRLALNLILSLGMLSLCTWLVWPDAAERADLHQVILQLRWADFAPYLAASIGLQATVHLCRSLRWNHLLAPLGVKVPTGPLLAMSSVGYMAILALPARLGEFVRPGLLRKAGYTTASAGLGTIAVERVVDGLIISLLVFCAFFVHQNPNSPSWMMRTAWGVLVLFSAGMIFLVFALRRPAPTVRFCLAVSLLPRFAPRLAAAIEHRMIDMIRGFSVLSDPRSLVLFVLWSLAYWIANGMLMWLLAHAFGLPLSVVGAFATMGLLGVGLMLPNSPGLVGQFQWFTLLGMSLYLGFDAFDPATKHSALYATSLAYAIAQHLFQVTWYVAMGALGLASPWVSFHDLWAVRKAPADAAEPGAADAPAELPRGEVERG